MYSTKYAGMLAKYAGMLLVCVQQPSAGCVLAAPAIDRIMEGMHNPWQIVGHDWAVNYFRRSIATGDVAHAYLLAGPSSIGKATLALRLAQALVCERGGEDPCLEYRACKRV